MGHRSRNGGWARVPSRMGIYSSRRSCVGQDKPGIQPRKTIHVDDQFIYNVAPTGHPYWSYWPLAEPHERTYAGWHQDRDRRVGRAQVPFLGEPWARHRRHCVGGARNQQKTGRGVWNDRENVSRRSQDRDFWEETQYKARVSVLCCWECQTFFFTLFLVPSDG